MLERPRCARDDRRGAVLSAVVNSSRARARVCLCVGVCVYACVRGAARASATVTANWNRRVSLRAAALDSVTALDDDKKDSLNGVFDLSEVQQLAASVDAVMLRLGQDGALYSGDVEFGKHDTRALEQLLEQIREASRKLAVMLAASLSPRSTPGRSKGTTTMSRLVDLQPLCGLSCDEVPFSALDDLVSSLNISESHRRTGTRLTMTMTKELPDRSLRYTPPAASLQRLKDLCLETVEQLEQLRAAREKTEFERGEKTDLARALKKTVLTELLPALKRRVLYVGLGRGLVTVQEAMGLFDDDESELFERVHADLEKCRDRVVQELTLRKLDDRVRHATLDDSSLESDDESEASAFSLVRDEARC